MGFRGHVDKQNQARDLRAQGWTLTEICEEVGCSKAERQRCGAATSRSTRTVLDERRRERFLAGNEGARRRGPNKLQRRKQAEIEEMRALGSSPHVGELSDRDLLIAGVALYAGEGSKTDGCGQVREQRPSDDPRSSSRGCDTFFEIDESRLRFGLYLHEGLDLDAANAFWSELTGIPLDAVRQPYRAVPDPSIRDRSTRWAVPPSRTPAREPIGGSWAWWTPCYRRPLGAGGRRPSISRKIDPG